MSKRVTALTAVILFLFSFFTFGCNIDDTDEIITYYHDTPDMAFINSMTLIDNYDFNFSTLEENGFEKRSDHIARRAGWWNSDTITFTDGCAIFDASYHAEGMPGVYTTESGDVESPAGFYGGAIMTEKKDYKYGYYEARIKMPNIKGFWGAFWITAPDLYQESGVTGAELDIVEAMYIPSNFVSSAIHYNYADLHSEMRMHEVSTDIYNNFVVYGMLWEENKYSFFINGVKVRETDFGGVSEAEEYIILSMECGKDMPEDTTLKSQMVVDYVRVYQ